MSRLSALFHEEKGEIFRKAIDYLENIDIPKSTKQAAAVAVAKALHLDGTPWDAELEQGVIYCIDYVLGDVRSWAKRHDDFGTVPPVTQPKDDPTTHSYATLDEARAAKAAANAAGGSYGIYLRKDGFYQLWPNIGPTPGEFVE